MPDSKARLILPQRRHYKEDWGDEELDLLARLVYHPIYGLLYRHRYRMALEHVPGSGDLLEIGCGYGLFLPALAGRAKNVHAVDVHRYLGRVDRTIKAEGCRRIFLSRADILRLPYRDSSFDTVVCMSVLEHVTPLDEAVSEIGRVLRKGGTLIAGFPVKNAVTRALFKLVGRDDGEIHPNSHVSIITALGKRLKLRIMDLFPGCLPVDLGLYCIGECVKDE